MQRSCKSRDNTPFSYSWHWTGTNSKQRHPSLLNDIPLILASIDLKYIWNSSYFNCGCKWKWRIIIAANCQFKQLGRRSLKKIRALSGFEPVTSAKYRCDALPTELIHWERGQFIEFISSRSSFLLLKLEIYCDDRSSLSSTTAVQIWIISYILHIISLLTGRYELNKLTSRPMY